MRSVLVYSLLRIAIFVVCFLLAVVAGADRLGAVIIGAVASLLLSYVLLRGPRDKMARSVEARVERRSRDRADLRRAGGRSNADADAEDSEVDRSRADGSRRGVDDEASRGDD